MRPQNQWVYEEPTPDTLTLAVSYMEAIANAHAFEQGNKRTGFDAGVLFLNLNGYDLADDVDMTYTAEAFIEVITNYQTTQSFEAYLSDYVVQL